MLSEEKKEEKQRENQKTERQTGETVEKRSHKVENGAKRRRGDDEETMEET